MLIYGGSLVLALMRVLILVFHRSTMLAPAALNRSRWMPYLPSRFQTRARCWRLEAGTRGCTRWRAPTTARVTITAKIACTTSSSRLALAPTLPPAGMQQQQATVTTTTMTPTMTTITGGGGGSAVRRIGVERERGEELRARGGVFPARGFGGVFEEEQTLIEPRLLSVPCVHAFWGRGWNPGSHRVAAGSIGAATAAAVSVAPVLKYICMSIGAYTHAIHIHTVK